MKKVKSLLALLLCMIFVLSACSTATTPETTENPPAGSGDQTPPSTDQTNEPVTPTQEYYSLYASEWPEMNYLVSSNGAVREAYSLLIDCFVQYDALGNIVPNAAESWDVSEDGLVWTFHLRDGLKWYDCDGNEVADLVADDYVAAAEYVLNAANKSRTTSSYTDYIVNAKDFYKGTITDFSQVGVKAVDEKTVEYTLIAPTNYFLAIASNLCFLPASRALLESTGERFATSNDTIYTSGAYFLTQYEPENVHVYTYNPGYWGVDEIRIALITETYNKEASSIGTELFRRGEISSVGLPDSVLDDWMNDPEKSRYVTPGSKSVSAVNFLLNFAVPNLEAEYEPENWNIAVNNKAFRQAIYYAIDRVAAASTVNSYIAEEIVSQTIVVHDYITCNGQDYTTMGPLGELSSTSQFNADLALQYKQQAMQELSGKVKFPVIIAYSYSTGSATSTNMVQVMKQQMEGLLGTDFITFEPVGFAASGFNTEVRNAGKFCMLTTSNGPDCKDPSTYLSMFTGDAASRYGSVNLATEYMTDSGKTTFDNMYEDAFNERLDVEARLNKFADAEAFLINEVLVIPFYCNSYSFKLTYLQPFHGYTTEKGVPVLKGAVMLDEQLTRAQYDSYFAEYQTAKAAASGN